MAQIPQFDRLPERRPMVKPCRVQSVMRRIKVGHHYHHVIDEIVEMRPETYERLIEMQRGPGPKGGLTNTLPVIHSDRRTNTGGTG